MLAIHDLRRVYGLGAWAVTHEFAPGTADGRLGGSLDAPTPDSVAARMTRMEA
jgi:hypothetical protein